MLAPIRRRYDRRRYVGHRTRRPARRPVVAAVAATVACLLPAACTAHDNVTHQPARVPGSPSQAAQTSDDGHSDARLILDRFAGDWNSQWNGHDVEEDMTTITNDAKFTRRLIAVGKTLQISNADIAPVGDLTCRTTQSCRARIGVKVTVAGIGPAHWTSEVAVRHDQSGLWSVVAGPATIHPKLTDLYEVRRVRDVPKRAPILDRTGTRIAWPQPVMHVGLAAGKATAANARAMAKVLGIDAKPFVQRLAHTPDGQLAEAIVLRKADYQKLRTKLTAINGLAVLPGTRELAPTAEFARGLLGTVQPATKETLKNAGPAAAATDEVGTLGLQAAYQRRLAGTPTLAAEIVNPATNEVIATIARQRGKAPRALTTTLSRPVQAAAQAALAKAGKRNVSLAVVDAGTGQVLAAANGPGPRNDNPAMTGHYAPGSTFKIVSAAALMAVGLDQKSQVNCTKQVVVDGRTFVNYDALVEPGKTTLAEAFALSCNTAFIRDRELVPGTALPNEAKLFGLGGNWHLPVPWWSGSVPVPDGATELAASMIGQARITASPLAMAEVVAAVLSGRVHTPTVVVGTKSSTGPRLPDKTLTQLQSMLRFTVADGTAHVLAGVGEVGAKTGTAEIGKSTNAWMVGYLKPPQRGGKHASPGYPRPITFAVIVEGGKSGSHDAGPVAKALLDGIRH